jgi:hypothetical protein
VYESVIQTYGSVDLPKKIPEEEEGDQQACLPSALFTQLEQSISVIFLFISVTLDGTVQSEKFPTGKTFYFPVASSI